MSQTTTRARKTSFEIVVWRPVLKNTLRGFATIQQPSGMIVADVGVHISGGKAWAAPPSRLILDRDGQPMLDNHGKTRWCPLVSFTNRETQRAWSDQVIAALKVAYPEALA